VFEILSGFGLHPSSHIIVIGSEESIDIRCFSIKQIRRIVDCSLNNPSIHTVSQIPQTLLIVSIFSKPPGDDFITEV
jgi:hypothetical protein